MTWKFHCYKETESTEVYCIHLKKKKSTLFFWINELIFHEKKKFALFFW